MGARWGKQDRAEVTRIQPTTDVPSHGKATTGQPPVSRGWEKPRFPAKELRVEGLLGDG